MEANFPFRNCNFLKLARLMLKSRDSLEIVQPKVMKAPADTSPISNGDPVRRDSITSTAFPDQTRDPLKRPGLVLEAGSPQEIQVAGGSRESSARTPETSSNSSGLDQILNIQQKTIDRVLGSVQTLQAEMETITQHFSGLEQMLKKQQEFIDHLLDSSKTLRTEIDSTNSAVTKIQESSRKNFPNQGVGTDQLTMQDPSTDIQDKFQQLSEDLSQIGGKVNEINAMKLALEAMKKRLEHLEGAQKSVTARVSHETSKDYPVPVQTAKRLGSIPGHPFSRRAEVLSRSILTESHESDSTENDATNQTSLVVAPQQSPTLNDPKNIKSKIPRHKQLKDMNSNFNVKHVQATALEELGPGEGTAVQVTSQSQQTWQALNATNPTPTPAMPRLTLANFSQIDTPDFAPPLTIHGLEDTQDGDYQPSLDVIDHDTQESDTMDYEESDSLQVSIANGANKMDVDMQPRNRTHSMRKNTMKPTRGTLSIRGRGRGGRPRKVHPRLVTPPWEKPDWTGPEDLDAVTKAITHTTPVSSRGRHIMRRGLSSGIAVTPVATHGDHSLLPASGDSGGRKRDSEGYLLRWDGARDKRSLRGRGKDRQGPSPVQRSDSHERLMGKIFPERRKAKVDDKPTVKLEDDDRISS